ncbi:MAG TPA: cellulase family glycosylhydrolase [Thermomicrobiales bacterium]|nr:cellulase family glycosylhydrolase [Thermomicrobiales bacterium]
MNRSQIDALTRLVAASRSRRELGRLFLGGALAAGALTGSTPASANERRGHSRKGHRGHGGHGGHGGCVPTAPTGARFTVSGRTIRDPAGNPVILRGVNKMSVFDDDDPTGGISFPEIRKTGANTVRIVWAIRPSLGRKGPKTDPNVLAQLIDTAIANRLVPMIELHDATGKWSRLGDLVAYWTQPQMVDIIAARQHALLVNIGNEVGNDRVKPSKFVAGYTHAVQALRCAGIHTPLVIDAPDYGKNLDTLNATAAALLDADPDHNLIFSVHLYWGIADGADANYIREHLEEAVAANYPLIVGEFSEYGAYNGNDSICAEGGRIDYQTILAETDSLGIGWYAWEWGPGNDFEDPLCSVMDMTPDRLFAHLQPGWAHEVALDSPHSIKNTAVTIL